MITSDNTQEQMKDKIDEHTSTSTSTNVPTLLSLAKIWVYKIHLELIKYSNFQCLWTFYVINFINFIFLMEIS